MSDVMRGQYEAVLRDLQERRAGYAEAIAELDSTISVITKQLTGKSDAMLDLSETPVQAHQGQRDESSRQYAKMSVRWAVLKLLAHSDRPMPTVEIARELELGGVESKAERFGSIVSAVVSDMKSKKDEVESVEDGYYRLTPKGREAWEHIEKSARYRYRFEASAVLPS